MTVDIVQLLTVDEVGHRLSLSRSQVYRLMRDGEVDSVKIGRARRIAAESVSAYIARMTAVGMARSRGR